MRRALSRAIAWALAGAIVAIATQAGAQSAEGGPRLVLAQADEPAPEATATPVPQASPTPTPSETHFKRGPRYVPPLFIFDKDEERGTDFRMLFMLYWADSNPDRSYRLFIPFFYERKNKHSQGTTYAGPGFYFYKSPASKAGYIPPVYIERGKEVSRTGVPPFFWYGRVGPKGNAETTSYLVPIYFYDERNGHRVLATPLGGGWGTRDDFQGLVGLYYWRNTHLKGDRSPYGRDVDLDAHVFFPLFWHIATSDTKTLVVGPVFSQRQQLASGGEHSAFGVFPFFYERRAAGDGRTIVTPLSIYERRDPQNAFLVTPLGGFSRHPDRSITVIGPYFDSIDGHERLQSIFPVFFHGEGSDTEGEKHSWTVAGPFFERRRSWAQTDGKTGSSRDLGVLPLFYYGSTGNAYQFLSPGVILAKREDGSFRGLFGPFYRSYGHGRQTWALAPGLWYHTSPSIQTSFGFLPFYYVHKKAIEPWTSPDGVAHEALPGPTYAGVFPVFFYKNRIQPWDGKRSRLVTLLPLFFFSEGTGRQTIVTPLFAQFRRPEDTRTMAAWLWWDHEARDYRNLTLLPIFHWERYGETRKLLTPVGGFERGEGYLTALWGPVYHRRDDSLGVRETVVFPLYWDLKSPDGRTLIFPPYYQVKEGSYFSEGFVPFWFHSSFPGSATTIVFPLFLAQYDKVENTRTIFTPLGGLWTNRQTHAYKLLAPLVYRANGPGQSTTVLFPLFWYDYDHGRQTVVIPPFFTRTDRDRKSATTGLLPIFFFHRDPASTTFVTLAGVIYARDEEQRDTVILPLAYWWSRDPYRSRGIAGPWLWSKSRRPGVRDFSRCLFPLYYETGKDDFDTIVTPLGLRVADRAHSLYAFPGFGWATRWNPATKELVGWNVLAGPLYFRKAPHAADAVLFPLFWHTHDEQHARTTILPIFDYERRGTSWRFVSAGFGGGANTQNDDWWAWFLNTYHSRRGDTSTTTVFPVAYVKKSSDALLVATPLFFHSRDERLHESTTLAPLFFRHTSPTRDTWVAFPLAWNDVDKERGIGVGGVLPFAIWMRSRERSWTAVPALLTYYERRGEDHLGIYGPLVDVQIEGRRTVALVPIFRYHREPDYASFASLPFIWWLKREGHTRAFVGVGYWNTETGTRIFPLYFRWQDRDENNEIERSTEVGLPIYVHYRTKKKDVKVIAPWYRIQREDGSSVVGVAPVWFATKKPVDHTRSWSVLGDLVGYITDGEKAQWTYLWVFHGAEKPVKKKSAAKKRHLADAKLLEPSC